MVTMFFLFPWANLLTYPRRMSVILNKKRGFTESDNVHNKTHCKLNRFPASLTIWKYIRHTRGSVNTKYHEYCTSCILFYPNQHNIYYIPIILYNVSNCLYFTQKLFSTYLIIIDVGILLLSIEISRNHNIVLCNL